jgi:hypothetical protein
VLSVAIFLATAVTAFAQTPLKITSGEDLPVPGKPVAADHGQLSEHNIEWMQTQPPQVEAEFLLSAAIEINLAVYNLAKTEDTAERLIRSAEERPNNRQFAGWELGMLASRGVEPERIHQELVKYMHDPEEKIRYWAVEGDAHLGTDETIKDFLEVLRSDPSMEVRERAGCSLAKSGMMTRSQRMKAVPGLIDLAQDDSLNLTTRSWVYQALREITNQYLPNDVGVWRSWYEKSGAERAQLFRQGEQWSVLGNN